MGLHREGERESMDTLNFVEAGGVYVTRHGYERMKERMGWDKNAARRMSQKAYEEGVGIKNVNGSLQKFIESKDEYYPENNIIRIYGNTVYCYGIAQFGEDMSTSFLTLVTVYPLPKKYNAQANGYQRRARNQEVAWA